MSVPIEKLLNENELFVYQNYKAMKYKQMAEALGCSTSRIGQYKSQAFRKIKEYKRKVINAEWNQQEETITLKKKELFMVRNALHHYYCDLLNSNLKNKKSLKDADDPEIELYKDIYEKIEAAINFEEHPSKVDWEAYWNQDAENI